MYSNICLRFQISCVNPPMYQNIWTGLSQQKLELITYHPISYGHDYHHHSLCEIEHFTFSLKSFTTSSADVICKQARRSNRCCARGDVFFKWLRIFLNHIQTFIYACLHIVHTFTYMHIFRRKHTHILQPYPKVPLCRMSEQSKNYLFQDFWENLWNWYFELKS